MASTTFIREKQINSGDYKEIDIYPLDPSSLAATRKKGRAKATHLTPPKQRVINTRRARQYLRTTARLNFKPGDYFLTLTFSAAHLPSTFEEAEREANKLLRRFRYTERQKSLDLKYIRVIEGKPSETVDEKRLHIHMLLSAGLSRTEMTNLWRRPKRKGEKQGELIGFVKIQEIGHECTSSKSKSDDDISALYVYLSKTFDEFFDEFDEISAEPVKGTHIRKRWSASHNIEHPKEVVDDNKYDPAEFYDIIDKKVYSTPKFLNDKYPGWEPLRAEDIQVCVDEDTGYRSIHLKLHRRR
jgi:hypothetical protein